MASQKSSGRPASRRYTPAERDRVVRAVFQLRKELSMDRGTVKRVADQPGIGLESLRNWVKQAEADQGI